MYNVEFCLYVGQQMTEFTIEGFAGFKLTTLMMLGTDCIQNVGSCKSNYHVITTTTTPMYNRIFPISYKQCKLMVKIHGIY